MTTKQNNSCKNVKLDEGEGIIKFQCHEQAAKKNISPKEIALLDLLIDERNYYASQKMIGFECGVGYGNISIRYQAGFWISASQTGHLTLLDRDDFSYVDQYSIRENSLVSQGKFPASSESLTHALLYEVDQSIQVVLHIHNGPMWKKTLEHFARTPQNILYGTPEMANGVRQLFTNNAFTKNNYFVMAGHFGGVIFFGKNFSQIEKEYLKIINFIKFQ